ncbi:RNA recognition motif domain-containing protein [Roseibacillus persicicus]|uniref:RNA recognition motif domain-containing protein n=1 Tax=Roseibacillus persicicus TaxID=454148 RepID=UPI00280ED1B5|nr:hypothetical protein [Roseibacillus persicicus]MDQ8191042.1 hypothetical protein [Roseibacillus persicicus]
MSEQNENRNSRNRNGGNRNRNRSGGNGGQRNRNGNGRNGNGKNRNRNGGGGNGGGDRSPSQQRNELQPSRGRRAKPKPLTFWQKILKAIGIYKEPTAKPAGGNQRGPAKKTAAKKSGRVAGGGRVDQKGGTAKKSGQKPRRERKPAPPTKVETPRLYVGNLSYDTTEYDLEELFKGVGSVRKVELVYNRHTHKSKGYGFVNMANMEEAERAVEVLHDQPFMGRKLIVNGARSKGPNDGAKKKAEGGDSPQPQAQEEAKPATTEAPAEVPAEEEVHSLAPDKE